MTTYNFTFVVDADPHADDFEDKFIDAGCDDATFLLMRGAALVSFDRDAASYKDAVSTALQQIKSTGSSILRFDPDYLVGASEIANRSGLTKAAIGLFGKGERREGFPAPHLRLESKSPLWDWVSVSAWLVQQGKIAEEVHKEAVISRIINVGSQIRQLDPSHPYDVEAALEAV